MLIAALTTLLAAAVIADVLFVAAVFYHLWRYTLPGWRTAKVVAAAYGAATLAAIVLALWSLLSLRAQL